MIFRSFGMACDLGTTRAAKAPQGRNQAWFASWNSEEVDRADEEAPLVLGNLESP